MKDENNNYIKDTNPYQRDKDKISNDVIAFYMQINQLKNLYRQGWIRVRLGEEHITKCESVADHSFALGMLAMSVIDKYKLGYDVCKCLRLALIHELGEIYAGDITPVENILEEEKHKLEEEAVKRVLKEIEFENDYFRLWKEYENGSSDEAVFIKELDKLEFIMQAASYQIDVSYLNRSKAQIKTPILVDILNELIEITKNKNKPNKIG